MNIEKVDLDFGYFRLKFTLKTFTNSDVLTRQARSNFQTVSNSDCLSLRNGREKTGEQISLSRSLDVLILDVISVLGEHSRDVVLDLIDSTDSLLIPGGELADIGNGSAHITSGADNGFSS